MKDDGLWMMDHGDFKYFIEHIIVIYKKITKSLYTGLEMNHKLKIKEVLLCFAKN